MANIMQAELVAALVSRMVWSERIGEIDYFEQQPVYQAMGGAARLQRFCGTRNARQTRDADHEKLRPCL